MAARTSFRPGALLLAASLAASALGSCGGDHSFDLGGPACVGKTGGSGEAVVDITSGGRPRRFRLFVPSSYDPSRGTPLVFDFHGALSDGAEQEGRSKFRDVGEANGFLVATPDGYEQTWNAEVCCGKSMADGIDDLGFVRDIVSAVEDDYCVDRSRIYAAGYSNGGIFSMFLACRADDLIAAAASVEAASLDASRCQPSRPVPVFFLNGTGDPVVPYAVAPGSVALWRQIDGCSDASEITFDQGDSRCEQWSECDAGTAVGFCTIEGGGHTWPGGGDFPPYLGKKSEDLPASEEIWKFFSAHALPEP